MRHKVELSTQGVLDRRVWWLCSESYGAYGTPYPPPDFDPLLSRCSRADMLDLDIDARTMFEGRCLVEQGKSVYKDVVCWLGSTLHQLDSTLLCNSNIQTKKSLF